jgi:peptidoglycan/LPS O-acetylase OafA/YrhL
MIPGLNGLRAIAFLLVFFFHTHYLDVGWIGVQLFFVLSGFLITGILLDMKDTLPKMQYFKNFYGRRALRIFPLYYFYLVIMFVLATWLISIDYRPGWMDLFIKQVKYAVFYIYNFHSATIFHEYNHFLTHFWSLSVEEQFYIFWPLLIFLTPEKWRKAVFISLIAMAPILRLGVLFIHNTGEIRMLIGSPAEAIYTLPISHIDSFAFGAYISRYPLSNAKQQFFILLGAIPAIGYATQYIASGGPGMWSALGFPHHMDKAYQFIWGYSLLNYFFAVLIYIIVKYGIFIRLLEWKPLEYMGRISYGLYIFHLPIFWFALDIGDLGVNADWVNPLATTIAFFGSLLIASISYHVIEKPVLHLKDHFFPLLNKKTIQSASQNAITRPSRLRTFHQ